MSLEDESQRRYNQLMQIALLMPEYIIWHYTVSLRQNINIIINFIWLAYHFFSVPLLLKTLFSPLRWGSEALWNNRGGRFALRVAGFVVRTLTLAFGLMVFVMVALFGILFFLIWLVLPLVIVGLFVIGVRLIFS